MKKILAVLLVLTLTLTGAGGVVASAFGTGIEVIANGVTLIKTGLVGQKLRFSDSDFKSAFCIADFDSITVTALPSSAEGTLLLAGRRISEGQTIKRKNIAAMVFVPLSADIKEASFEFTLDGQSGAVTKCQMKFIDRINMAPETPSVGDVGLSLTTQAEISVYGRMIATDPEGDALEYIIVSYPERGTLTITDAEGGRYKYTPLDGYTGYDDFVYVARDCYGNYSDTVTVSIKTVERMSGQEYRDMTNRAEYNAAVAMSAMGIMSGRVVGDDSYFMPDESVTKAEFVAMAMKAMGLRADSSLKMSYFDDNDKIPESLVGYVATAQRLGIIDGDFTSEGLVFNPNDSINAYQAASIMSKLMGIESDSEETEYTENDTVPIWARADVYAMFTLGIFDGDAEQIDGGATLTRAEAAEYLYRMIKI